MNIEDLFNKNGNLDFDPFRMDYNDLLMVEKYNFLFDEDGDLNMGISEKIIGLINNNKWNFSCDAIGLYHADIFAMNTKGNYSTIYYFR